MATYRVTWIETVRKEALVEAKNEEEALEEVDSDMAHSEKVLDMEDWKAELEL